VPRERVNGDVVIWLVLMRWRFFLVWNERAIKGDVRQLSRKRNLLLL
jgi:hypothetical protein